MPAAFCGIAFLAAVIFTAARNGRLPVDECAASARNLAAHCGREIRPDALELTDTGHAHMSAFVAIVSARCDDAAPVTTAPRQKARIQKENMMSCLVVTEIDVH